MASTATASGKAAKKPITRRAAAAAAADFESSPSTAAQSPVDSPRHSASSTSLSSMSELDDIKPASADDFGKLIDLNGNEFKVPDYTIKDIRDAIPKHCFERSAIRSLSYVARDFVCLAVTFTLFHNFNTSEYVPNTAARGVLWAAYSVLQGLFGTGLWVLAHECGHGAFSPSKTINDFVGWVLHSLLLVPYFSWQMSHSKHHKSTGNIERDMVFVPRTRDEHASKIGRLTHELSELTEETPIATLINVVAQQLFGWPMYLITNVTGHNYHEKQREGRGVGKVNGWFTGVNHFNPSSPLYENRDAILVIYSDIGLALVGTGLYFLIQKFGFANIALWYFIPYLWVNHWLVAITYLQHTDPTLPHYHSEEWNFVRGAAATIDREFGFVGRHLLHGIIETHVLHHYVSTIPFYNADEATEAIKPVMGVHYRSDVRGGPIGFLKAIWSSARSCQWVEPSEGATDKGKNVLFYRNHNGIGTQPATLSK
ncbi:delta fatty acid desaturase [Ophiostoma piceae UAMH 11346]|uniref:Delta fatty acid desaturase n=1 Tax=Ophiostoma piceae (strain UAMH 11346) TaxID=1262450 RepID=S3BUM2_OPHP1|nr:delta fatty acid desaturase [Ophiostoma piceae UAMH 11346]